MENIQNTQILLEIQIHALESQICKYEQREVLLACALVPFLHETQNTAQARCSTKSSYRLSLALEWTSTILLCEAKIFQRVPSAEEDFVAFDFFFDSIQIKAPGDECRSVGMVGMALAEMELPYRACLPFVRGP